MHPFLSAIEAAFEKHKMLPAGGRLLVACSGGPDSTALFQALRMLSPRLGMRLGLLHFDHALRRGSERDREFVRRLAQSFKIPFYSARRRTRPPEKNLSPEEAARKSRYEFFKRTARRTRIRKIALGHHRDDRAETVLMRLLQGTGLRGLQGMRPIIQKEGVTYIRPLLHLSRAEILGFLKENSFAYRKDPTNLSPHFLRNRIRHELLPLLERKFNPRMREILIRLAETARIETAGWDEWAKDHWRNFIRYRKNGTVRLHRDSFLSLPPSLQFRVLDHALRAFDPESGLNFKSWERIEAGLKKRRFRMSLPRNLDLALTPQTLSFSRRVK